MDFTSKSGNIESIDIYDNQDRIETIDTMCGRSSTPLTQFPQRSPVDIEFSDLTYTIPTGRKGIPYIQSLFNSELH